MNADFIAKRITQLRMQRGLSARKMSTLLGQANNYINSIENRKSNPSVLVLLQICDLFEISPAEFFDEGNSAPEALRELIEESKDLDPDALSHLIHLIKALNKK